MGFDFRQWKNAVLQLTINGQDIVNVLSFSGLSSLQSVGQQPKRHCEKIPSKAFFLRQLKKFGISKVAMFNLYRAFIESVLTFSLIWQLHSTAEKSDL